MKSNFFLCCVLVLPLFAGCSSLRTAPDTSLYTAGALGGAGIGAGVGVLAGDSTEATLIGMGIGVPAGIAAVAAAKYLDQEMTLSRYDSAVEENYLKIVSDQRKIDGLRDFVKQDTVNIELDESLRSRIYDGPTRGLYYR